MTEPEPLWHGRHGHGAMGRHKDDLRAEATARQVAYQAAHPTPAVKLLDDIYRRSDRANVENDQIIQDAGEIAIADTKPRRRRRNVTRQHKAE